MKRIIQILPLVALVACSDLTKFNKNQKDPGTVPGSTLFTNGQKALVDQLVEANINNNIFRLIVQYWTQTTYTDESNYRLTRRRLPGAQWVLLYRGALKNLDEAYKVTEKEDFSSLAPDKADKVKNNRLAITETMIVFGYAMLVDTFGDIPYTEALNADTILLPKYDDGLTVYKDLIARLNGAIAKLDASADSFDPASDNIYQGDVSSWIKFANSLKLRMGITISDVASVLAKKTVEDAVTAGVFSDNADDATMDYLASTPNTHPVYLAVVLSGRRDFVITKTLVDTMNTLQDPRRGAYYDEVGGEYVGGVVGASNSYSLFSHMSKSIKEATAKGVVLTYSEVEFLMAEAAERGYGVAGTAQDHYDKAIGASIKSWGGSDGEVNAYLAQPDVAYATAQGDWKQKIGVQSWIALYNRGFEAWTSWRRLDHPVLKKAADAESDIPVRFPYPIQEQTLNAANLKLAAEHIGGDGVTTKLFWDIYSQPAIDR